MEIFGLNLTRDSAEMLYCFPQLKESCPRSQTLIIIKSAKYICMAFIILMTFFGNLLVIISISHFRQLHSPTNLLILSLALIDWLLGSFVMPYSMIRSVENCWYFGETFCMIHSSIDIMMSLASLLNLGLISVDRYLAICKPLQYKTSVTMYNVAGLIGISWIISFAYAFGLIFFKINLVGELFMNSCTGTCFIFSNKQEGVLSGLLGFVMPCTVMIALYMKIFYVAKVQARKITCSLAVTGSKQEKKNCTPEQRENKAAKTLAIVLGVFLLSWLPLVIILSVDPFFDLSTPAVVFEILIWLAYFNSSCNPLIYGYFFPWFRRVFKIIISGQVFQNESSFLNIYAENK